MFGRRKKIPEVVGIHVGRTTLTFVRVIKHPDRVEIRQLFHTALPRALSAWPADAVRQALLEAKKKINLKADEVRLSLPSDLAPNHFLLVPSTKQEQLDSAVKLQLEHKLGNQCGQLSYQFQVLEKRGEQYRVFCTSLPTERLRVILASFADINCPVDLVEVESVSVANLVASRITGTSPVAVLHICSDWSEIHVLRRGQVALSRPIPKLENDVDRAGETVPQDSSGELAPGSPAAALGSWYLDRISREANKTLDYFEIELLLPAVERLWLIGEAASLAGLDDILAQQLAVKVEVLGPGGSIDDATKQYDPVRHSLAVAAAVGEEEAS